MGVRKSKRPSIYCDEHLSQEVCAAFREAGLRTIEIRKDSTLKGRDEKTYISELYRRNGIFVTSDEEAIQDFLQRKVKHAGIVFVPKQMEPREKALWAGLAAEFIRGATSNGPFALRGEVIYPAHDGLRVTRAASDELMASWDRLFENG
jgi:hypothetical protein